MEENRVPRKERRFIDRFYPGIGNRVTLPFLAIIIIIAGIGVFIVTRLVAGSIHERLNNQLLNSDEAARNAIVEMERKQLSDLRLMIFTEGVADALRAGSSQELETILRPIALNADMEDVVVFDADGECLLHLTRQQDWIAAGVLPVLNEWPGVQHVLSPEGADEFGDKHIDIIERDGKLFLYTVGPLVPEGSEDPIGGIGIGMTIEDFTRRVGQQALAYIALLTPEGDVLSTTFSDDHHLALSPEEAREIGESSQGSERSLREQTVGDLDYRMLYGPLVLRSESVGIMAVALPSHFVAEQLGLSRDTFIALFTALFIFVGILGVMVSRSIIVPIRRLVRTTRAIRGGDLSRRVRLDTPDELGELGFSFDVMADWLVERNRRIEGLYENQVKETARRDAILSGISDGVFVLSAAGDIILQNPKASKIFGEMATLSPDEHPLAQIFEDPAQYAEARTLEVGDAFYSILTTPVGDPSQSVSGHVIVFRDITALIEAERLKDKMILQLSHELRTPLAAARGYTELSVMLGGESKHAEYMRESLKQLDILMQMINQVIDVSLMLSDRFRIDKEPFNLRELVLEVMDRERNKIDARDIGVRVDIGAESVTVNGDRNRMANVLEHIVRNAYSYTLPGGEIDVGLDIQNGHAVISVADTGVGISPGEIDKVFERMYRGSSADAGPTDTRGLGLGLYISKEIVDAHQGEIRLESEENVGTTVRVLLPRQKDVFS